MLEIVTEVDSTNSEFARRLSAGEHIAENHWLVADRQTAGRGRQGRNWTDGAGNFMGSTVVRRHASDPAAPTLALLAGLSLYETAVPLVPNPGSLCIKWPNDLLYAKAKLAGILLEGQGDAVIVGIGVNLAASPDLPDRETICFGDLAPAPDRDAFAQSLSDIFARELERWRTYGLEPLIRRWSAAATPIGTPLRVHDSAGDILAGSFVGLTETGALLLRLSDGATRAINAGDVMLA